MRAAHYVLVLVAVSSAFAACTETTEPVTPPEPPRTGVIINPSCGKEKDVVRLTMPDSARCEVKTVRFSPGESVEFSAARDASGACIIEATVPASARTGTVEVAEHHGGSVQTEQLYTSLPFTIPCPPDAGPNDPDASTPDSSVPAGPPLNAVFLHRRVANSTLAIAQAYTFATMVGDPQRAAIGRHEALLRAELAPAGIPVGTCATLDLPDPGPDLGKPIYRGPLSLKAGTSTVFDALQCDANFVYQKSYTHPEFAASIWELSWAGDGAEQGFTIPDATGPIPSLGITTPNPTLFDVDVPQGAFTVVWNATVAKLMTIHLLRSSGAPVVCVADPLAGSFTIPANFIGGPGDVEMTINGGDLRRLAIAQLALAIMTMQLHSYEFTLHVQ